MQPNSEMLQEQFDSILNSLKEQLENLQNVAQKYKDELSNIHLADLKEHGIISESMEMRQLLNAALKLARLDVSNIAATNRDLQTRVEENAFRPDLYHRLNVFSVKVPPCGDGRKTSSLWSTSLSPNIEF